MNISDFLLTDVKHLRSEHKQINNHQWSEIHLQIHDSGSVASQIIFKLLTDQDLYVKLTTTQYCTCLWN